MASAQELFKEAVLGLGSSRTPGIRIKTMGEECANEIVSNPNRDGISVVSEKAREADLNKNQIARLIEVTNHAMMQPVLRSQSRGSARPVVNKNKVFSRMGFEEPQQVPEYKHNEFSGGTFDRDEAAQLPKTASMSKLAMQVSSDDFSDYHEEPVSLGDFPREEFVPDADISSDASMSKLAGYAAEKKENATAEREYLEMEYHAVAGGFAKVASQYVLLGTPLEDIVAASIQYKPEKSTISLLKMAANSCFKRGLFTGDELKTWVDSLDYIRDSNPSFAKMAGLGIPVSDSLISNDLRGRVRIMNGDSQIIRYLDTVGKIEDRIRKARLIEEQIPDREIVREMKRTVTNVSDQ